LVLLLERLRIVSHGGKPSLGCTDSRLRIECVNRNLTAKMGGLAAFLRVAASSNPSLKRSANGMSHWPSSAGPSAHFALAVQRAMPLGAA